MELVAQLAVLAVATVLAAGVAFGMAWAFLQGAFHLMQPAAATKPAHHLRPGLAQGTRAAARGFALQR